MQFMVKYSLNPENRDAVQGQFKETGGLPPAGIEMLGRWHNGPSLWVTSCAKPTMLSHWVSGSKSGLTL